MNIEKKSFLSSGYGFGMYTSSSEETCQHIAETANCNIFIVDSNEQLEKILNIRRELKDLKAIVKLGHADMKRMSVAEKSFFYTVSSGLYS